MGAGPQDAKAVGARILAHSPAMAARYIHPDDRAVKDAMERLAEAWEAPGTEQA